MFTFIQGEAPEQQSLERNFASWARHYFMLRALPSGESFIVRKPGTKNAYKNIAIKEQLYEMIADAHETAGHGRRDAMNYKVNQGISVGQSIDMYTYTLQIIISSRNTCTVPGDLWTW